MKKVMKQNPYLIRFGRDDGDPENGPVMNGGVDVIYAISKDDAIQKWEDEVDTSQFDSYWAEPITEEEAQKYIDENGLDEYDQSYIEMMKQYVIDHHLERFVKELNSQGNNFEGALEWVYDQNTMTPQEFKRKYYR